MRTPGAREMAGDPILSVRRFHDDTRWMIEFVDRADGEEVRRFLNDRDYLEALEYQKKGKIRIRRYAHVVEGHVLDFSPKKRRRR